MSAAREAYEAHLENGQGNQDCQGRYIGDPLDLWFAGWEAAISDLELAFEAEIAKVSHVEYDSNEICRHFFSNIRKAMAPAAPKTETPKGEQA